eukprot:2186460-Pleurochrysis_carterae.AAC.4
MDSSKILSISRCAIVGARFRDVPTPRCAPAPVHEIRTEESCMFRSSEKYSRSRLLLPICRTAAPAWHEHVRERGVVDDASTNVSAEIQSDMGRRLLLPQPRFGSHSAGLGPTVILLDGSGLCALCGSRLREQHKIMLVGLPSNATSDELIKLCRPYGNPLE